MKNGTQAEVAYIPPCDLCKQDGKAEPSLAYADARLPLYGSWAYVCKTHFDAQGCELGLGRGQELILHNPDANLKFKKEN